MEQDQIAELLERYHEGRCTATEIAAVEAWYNFYGANNDVYIVDEDLDKRKEQIWAGLALDEKRNPQKFKIWRFAAAAIITLVICGVYFMLKPDHEAEVKQAQNYANDIAPGKQGATLILSNGKKIRLTEASKGELAREAGMVITKSANGQLIYRLHNQGAVATAKTNMLTTAKGETYQVILPDGTMIWLNSASSLTYPSSFDQMKQRKVKLKGEAYFEVAKDKTHPFVVETDGQRVEVLGTHFNINSYVDEPAVKTTLVEGSVKIVQHNGSSEILKPGQQASLSAAGINVATVDTYLAVAWKNNNFVFEHDDIQFIMRMVARWYNVDVSYQGDIPEEKFSGGVPRFENVSNILRILEGTGKVSFKVKDRTIVVSK